MTVLGAVVFIAITAMFICAALLIVKCSRAEPQENFQPPLNATSNKHIH